ncbi:MAG: hypothetical protein ACRDIU_03395, partial [Actinomycetota bacterium]
AISGITTWRLAGADSKYAVLRYEAAGGLNAVFGYGNPVVGQAAYLNAGRSITDFGGKDAANGVLVTPDGRTIAAGCGGSTLYPNLEEIVSEDAGDFTFSRYDSSGLPLPTTAELPPPVGTGTLPPSANSVRGQWTTDFAEPLEFRENECARGLALSGSKIVAAGKTSSGDDFAVVRQSTL